MELMIFDFDGNDNDNNDDYHDVDGFDNVHLGRTPWNSWWLGRLNWSRHLPLVLATVLYQASHMCKDIWPLIKNHNPSSLLLQKRFQPERHLSSLYKSYSPHQSLAEGGWHLFVLVNHPTYPARARFSVNPALTGSVVLLVHLFDGPDGSPEFSWNRTKIKGSCPSNVGMAKNGQKQGWAPKNDP